MLNGTSVTVPANMENLLTEVQRMVDETSNKFVRAPQIEEILEDLLVGIKRFKNSARWKEFWRNKIQDNKPKEPSDFHETGYRTGLRNPNYSPEAPKGSKELEGFLQSLERELITGMLNVKSAKKNNTSKQINRRYDGKTEEL